MRMPTVVRAAEAPQFELPGILFTGLAAPSRGSAQVCTWRLAVEPGLTGQPHVLDRDEVFMVLSGRVRVTPDGELIGAGDAVTVPAGESIALSNPGAEPAELYVAIPAGFTATTAEGTPIGTPPWAQ
jgi:mannose-6-phosphate isomerase-like protein (cupin superfamily)